MLLYAPDDIELLKFVLKKKGYKFKEKTIKVIELDLYDMFKIQSLAADVEVNTELYRLSYVTPLSRGGRR